MRDGAGMKPVRVSAKRSASGDTRFAVVTMTRMPYRFEDWLKYYRALGTHHLFIAVEESPEVEMLLAEAPWCDMVTTSRSKPEQNPYETVITRQERVMAWAVTASGSLDDGRSQHRLPKLLGTSQRHVVPAANPRRPA